MTGINEEERMANTVQEVVMVDSTSDWHHVEEEIRRLLRVEATAPCVALQSMTYKTFKMRCLRALQAALHPSKLSQNTPAFDAYIGNNVVLRYEDKRVKARLRMPSLPGSVLGRKRKQSGVESYQVLGSDSE